MLTNIIVNIGVLTIPELFTNIHFILRRLVSGAVCHVKELLVPICLRKMTDELWLLREILIGNVSKNIYCQKWKIWTYIKCANKMGHQRTTQKWQLKYSNQFSQIDWFHVLVMFLGHFEYLKGNVCFNTRDFEELKENLIQEIRNIAPDVLRKVIETVVQRMR